MCDSRNSLFKNVLIILDKVDPLVHKLVSEHGDKDWDQRKSLNKGPLHRS